MVGGFLSRSLVLENNMEGAFLNHQETITMKILCYRDPVCYSVWRIVRQVINHLSRQFPEIEFKIDMIRDSAQIAKYTHNLVLPSLVINEKLVCSGQIPSQKDVLTWLQVALAEKGYQPAGTREH